MRKHVVHIMGSVAVGGIEQLVLGLVRAINLNGYKHSVVCLKCNTGHLESAFKAAGVPVLACPFHAPFEALIPGYRPRKWFRRYTFPLRLARLLEELKPGLVHAHNRGNIDLQMQAIFANGPRPFVWTLHSIGFPSEDVCAKAASDIWGNGGAITADSEAVRRAFSARAHIPPERITTVYPGIDITGVISGGAPRGTLRKRWGIPSHALIFGCVGRLSQEKGYDLLIKAASKYAIHHPDAHFVIAGDGPLRVALESDVQQAGLTGKFHLLGYHEDLPGFLREIDVFALPSRREGFPLALIEALAAGRPCIAADVGGVAEMLGSDGGILVPAEDVDALVAAMERMTDSALRASFSRRAPDIARAFSLKACAEHFLTIYERVLSTPRRGGA